MEAALSDCDEFDTIFSKSIIITIIQGLLPGYRVPCFLLAASLPTSSTYLTPYSVFVRSKLTTILQSPNETQRLCTESKLVFVIQIKSFLSFNHHANLGPPGPG